MLNPQTNTQKQKTIERGNKPKKKKMNQKKNEELRPLKLHRWWFQPSKSPRASPDLNMTKSSSDHHISLQSNNPVLLYDKNGNHHEIHAPPLG